MIPIFGLAIRRPSERFAKLIWSRLKMNLEFWSLYRPMPATTVCHVFHVFLSFQKCEFPGKNALYAFLPKCLGTSWFGQFHGVSIFVR